MRSSEAALRRVVAVGACALALLAACAVAPPGGTARPPEPACTVDGPALAAAQAALAQELQRVARSAPLFAASIAPSGVAACRIEAADAAVSLAYRATSGNQLHVRRDEAIEYTEWEARFVAPPGDPAKVLQQAERAAFGADGCGIDWQRPETVPAGDGRETRFRGHTCQCQASMRRDAAGKVVALGLRSTC